MESLRLPETQFTPEVNLEKERSRFEFYGKSYPEGPDEFYGPIVEWFREYAKNPNRETIVLFKLDYFNTSSSKRLVDIFKVLWDIHKQKKTVIVNWYYRSGDEDLFESGETFSELVGIPFKLIPYN